MMCYPLGTIMVIPSYLKMRYDQHLRNKGCRHKPGCSMFSPPATLLAYSAFSCWSYTLSCNLQYQIQYQHSNWTIHDMSPTPYDANEAIKERGGGEREREREREREFRNWTKIPNSWYIQHKMQSEVKKEEREREREREQTSNKSLPHKAVLWLQRQLQAAKRDFRC